MIFLCSFVKCAAFYLDTTACMRLCTLYLFYDIIYNIADILSVFDTGSAFVS